MIFIIRKANIQKGEYRDKFLSEPMEDGARLHGFQILDCRFHAEPQNVADQLSRVSHWPFIAFLQPSSWNQKCKTRNAGKLSGAFSGKFGRASKAARGGGRRGCFSFAPRAMNKNR